MIMKLKGNYLGVSCHLLIGFLILISQSTAQTTEELANHPDAADCSEIAAQELGISRPPSRSEHLIVGAGKRGKWAYCDMDTDGGGWTIIQRRSSATFSFNRTWTEYEQGFGDTEGDHWLGNTYLRSMTVNKRYVLRIELTDWENNKCYAEYSHFVVGGSGCKYTLESLGTFCGDCGDSLTTHVGKKFSTFEQDNDDSPQSCAKQFKGAWWYGSCHASNLNGEYKVGGRHDSYADGINWLAGKGYNYSYKISEMKIRPFNY